MGVPGTRMTAMGMTGAVTVAVIVMGVIMTGMVMAEVAAVVMLMAIVMIGHFRRFLISLCRHQHPHLFWYPLQAEISIVNPS